MPRPGRSGGALADYGVICPDPARVAASSGLTCGLWVTSLPTQPDLACSCKFPWDLAGIAEGEEQPDIAIFGRT